MMIKPIQEKFGYVKRELRLKVFKLNLEVEKLKNKVAEANTERDSALDEAVVAWGELDVVRARENKLAKFIVMNCEDFTGDHACFECHPCSDLVMPGFQCGPHLAKSIRHDTLQQEPTQ
jgi:hypothetical protein